jgi:hypothetical protein
MKVKTFWTILIKILGISLVISGLSVIMHIFSALPIFVSNPTDNVNGTAYFIGIVILTIALYVFVLWLFVFRTAWLINKLHLDKGFEEEEIGLNIKQSTVLTVAVIVVGGVIFIDSFPHLCKQIFVFIQSKNTIKETPGLEMVIVNLVKTIIGYLLMTNSQLVTKFINRKSETPE